MPDYSSIAIFSTENKIKNIRRLYSYLINKHIVLAFDNDQAGEKCFEYYEKLLLSNRFEIQTLRKLLLPENKDVNDLLQTEKLEAFLKDKNNYRLIWEDIVTKPLPSDSKNKRKDNDENYFYIEKGCYFTKETIKGKPIIKKLSNF